MLYFTQSNDQMRSGPEIRRRYSFSMSMNFILLINVKMPTIVGILTFISRINTAREGFKARKSYWFRISIF